MVFPVWVGRTLLACTALDPVQHHWDELVQDWFKAAPRPHLGSSDYIAVMLIPTYKPLVTRTKPSTKQLRVWPQGAIMALQGCFESTDWSVFKEVATNSQGTAINKYADPVSSYIYKCMEDVCVTKNTTVRANEKPWMTAEVRSLLKERNAAFKSGDEVSLRSALANLNKAIRVTKRAHGKKNSRSFQGPQRH